MRVLVSAYACEPGKGSEPGVGWNWVCQIARFSEVWVITRANNRNPIEIALANAPLPDVHFIYFDLPIWARFWKRGTAGIHTYNCLWQLGAYFAARRLHRQISFDVVHHVTFGTYWTPSFLPLLPVPFVWGPVGGGESAPRAFWHSFSLRGKFYEFVRDLARWVGNLNPTVRFDARRAAVALSKTTDTGRQLTRLGSPRVLVCSEVGLPSDEIERLGALPLPQPGSFRLVSVGRLIHWKGFELGLRAFAQFHRDFPESSYWLIGDGPERKRLENLSRKLSVAASVQFLGAMPRAQVLEKLAACDVLVHPSLHDSGGWVCVEAMAAGRPVICLDLGGPAIQVTEETGIKIPAISSDQVIQELAEAMGRLACGPTYRQRLGKAGRRHIRAAFNWQEKGGFIAGLYNGILSEKYDHAC